MALPLPGTPIILDIGSSYVKIGFAGEPGPRYSEVQGWRNDMGEHCFGVYPVQLQEGEQDSGAGRYEACPYAVQTEGIGFDHKPDE